MLIQPKPTGRRELLAGAGAFVVWGVVALANMHAPREQGLSTLTPPSSLQLSRSFQSASTRVQRSTVEFVRWISGSTADSTATSSPVGSGVIIDSSGIVLTTRDVIEHSGELRVRLNDGTLLEIRQPRFDQESRLAAVAIDLPESTTTALVGAADKLQPGDWVIAVSSVGDDRTHVKPGTIHGIRPADPTGGGTEQLLLTDAAINPGVEGAPIVDLSGAVVGLVCNRWRSATSDPAVGTAVSVQRASPWMSALMIHAPSHAERKLGLTVQPVTNRAVERQQLGAPTGVEITRVIPNTPGTEAGLQVGDVVIALGDRRIKSPDDLHFALDQLQPGQRKPVEIVRNGWRMTSHICLPATLLD